MADSPHPNASDDAGVSQQRRTPRWLNVFGLIAIVAIVVIFIIMLVSGGHGPGRHMR